MNKPLSFTFALLSLAATTVRSQADWIDITTGSGSPPVRFHHAMTYDRSQSEVVAFGGYGAAGVRGDTWVWSTGPGWVQRTPAVSPPPTYGSLLAYDRARGHCVMFAGRSGGLTNQLWTWDGATWTQLSPAVQPSPRYFPGFIYDPSTSTILMFGGYDGSAHINDTWRWDGSAWTQLIANGQPGSPPGRRGPGFAWDEHRDVAVMFGGLINFSPNTVAYDDTWEWNGAWILRTPTNSPPPRGHSGMDFDALRGRMVLNGGDAQGVYHNDTWEYDGSDWVQRSPTTTPSDSTGTGLVYDPVEQRIFRHGGFDAAHNPSDETWVYASNLPASFTIYGSGCGSTYTPGLAVAPADLPWVGQVCTVQVTNVPASLPTLLVAGFDDVSSPLGPLPFSLAALGAPGCDLLASPHGLVFLGPAPASWSTGVMPAYGVGISLFVQAGVLDNTANSLGVTTSPGGRLTVGVQ